MLVHHSGAYSYLFAAIEATPDLVSQLLRGLNEEEADFRPVPDRFNLREVVAHLADWDAIFLHRMKKTLNDELPTLIEIDESERSLEFDYAHTNVVEQLQLLHERRAQISEFLRALSLEQWERVAFHPSIGHVTIEAQATLMTFHDSYHLRQIMDWRKAFALYQSVLD